MIMRRIYRTRQSWCTEAHYAILIVLVSGACGVGFGRDSGSARPIPEVRGLFGSVPQKFQDYEVILKPDKDEPQWWAGAPSVVRDRKGIFWLACRMRTADAPLGLRGYEIRILRSEDGTHFKKVHSILREDVPIPGFERPALLIDPQTGRFKLYACGPWKQGPWCIIKFVDADDPTKFIPSSAKVVIAPQAKSYPRDVNVNGYKDPFILHAEGAYHCYVIGVVRGTERLFHFCSRNGEQWEPVGSPYQPIMDLESWHDFFVRPASVLPIGAGYLFIYEGSNNDWYDPVYNIATGLAFTFDLHNVIDLTPDSPLIVSTTASEHFHTWRYSHWMHVDDEIWVYAEVAKPNDSNEIRLFRLHR
ncbi:MAG: hypothetical protein A2Z25_05075 [Planctomycetes bacterium RBG_16_55_9]|nr:MAG: hypothetical protein A2Z25_05075 [Planctomycetes bacterium RBG_16_55_9]